jgi:hypothetical protein
MPRNSAMQYPAAILNDKKRQGNWKVDVGTVKKP